MRTLEALAPSAELGPLDPDRRSRPRPTRPIVTRLPGLVLVAGCVAVAFAVYAAVPSASPLVVSVALGALLANAGLVPAAAGPGTTFAAKRLLRVGVVLLGLQLAVGDVFALGGRGVALVVGVVMATFFGTQWAGRRLGLSPALSLLVATGYSICGASAVAAMEGVSEADEDDVAYAVGLVTLCGSLCILVLPALRGPLGLDATAFGSWVGASVHDVGQVVATASSGGALALQTAVVVKLTRVVLLAPLVAGVSLTRRRRSTSVGTGTPSTARPALLPLFVVGFLGAIALRSTGLVPSGWLEVAHTVERVVLCAALVGLGAGVRLSRLRHVGGRPLVLGLGAWVLVAVAAYGGVVVTGV